MLIRAALGVLSIMCTLDTAIAKSVRCSVLVETADRERCYDRSPRSQSSKPPAGGTANTLETPLIAIAKKAVRDQLRKPESAQFTMVSIKKAGDGSTAVCGMIDSR